MPTILMFAIRIWKPNDITEIGLCLHSLVTNTRIMLLVLTLEILITFYFLAWGNQVVKR